VTGRRALTPGRLAALAVLVALALRVGLALYLDDRTFWSDEFWYHKLGDRVAHGADLAAKSFTFNPPGQPFTLGGLYFVFGPRVLTARLFQAVLGACAVWLLYRLVRRFSVGAALLAAYGLAVYPLVVYTNATLYPQTEATLWLLGALNLLADHVERPAWKRLVAAGVCLACGALTIPTVLTVCPLIGVWLWWARRPSWRGVGEVTALAATVALALVPWQIRNYRVEGHFIPIATVGPTAFFFANNPHANPDSKDMALLDSVYTPAIKAEIARTGQADLVYSQHAWNFITHDTGRFLFLYAKRLGHFFDFTPHTFTRNVHTSRASAWIVGLTSAPVLLLALFGAWGFARRSRIAALWVLLPIVWGLASALFGVTIRYRVTVEPYIMATAAWALWHYGLRRQDQAHAQVSPAPRAGA
jgi:hypothetical protein